jgi:hypothetical protein
MTDPFTMPSWAGSVESVITRQLASDPSSSLMYLKPGRSDCSRLSQSRHRTATGGHARFHLDKVSSDAKALVMKILRLYASVDFSTKLSGIPSV